MLESYIIKQVFYIGVQARLIVFVNRAQLRNLRSFVHHVTFMLPTHTLPGRRQTDRRVRVARRRARLRPPPPTAQRSPGLGPQSLEKMERRNVSCGFCDQGRLPAASITAAATHSIISGGLSRAPRLIASLTFDLKRERRLSVPSSARFFPGRWK